MRHLDHLLQTDGFVSVREYPDLLHQVRHRARSGALVPLLRGVWTPAGPSLDVRLRAVSVWDPAAVVTGWAAGVVCLNLPESTAPVPIASPASHLPHPHFVFVRRRLPASFVQCRHGVSVTDPSMTAVDLAAVDDGEAIDTALRLRLATLDSLRAAFGATPGRRGNAERRRILHDSRDQPWSSAERQAHRLLRDAGVRGWTANRPIRVGTRTYFGDIVFADRRLVVEIDGWEHHCSFQAFTADRARQNALVNAGWRVLRFTWADLAEGPFVATVRQALRRR